MRLLPSLLWLLLALRLLALPSPSLGLVPTDAQQTAALNYAKVIPTSPCPCQHPGGYVAFAILWAQPGNQEAVSTSATSLRLPTWSLSCPHLPLTFHSSLVSSCMAACRAVCECHSKLLGW